MKEAYLHSVRHFLDCPQAEQERLLRQMDGAVSAWLEDNPDADETELIKSFGSPEICAARLLEECGPMEIVGERRKRTCRTRVLIAVLAVLLILAIGSAIYLFRQGGLVIIEHTRYGENFPEDLPMDQIIYHYDD